MVTDSKRFLAGQAHIARNDVNALLTVAVGEAVVILEGIDSLPGALLVLYVAEAFFVDVYLAKVVKEGYDGDALVTVLRADDVDGAGGVKIACEAIVNVYRMVDEAALV